MAAFAHIRQDLLRHHFAPGPLRAADALRGVWTLPGFQAVAVYRLGRWLRACAARPAGWPALVLLPAFWVLQAWVRAAYDIHLGLDADIGPGLYIGHFGGVRVAGCRLGSRCAIQQEVRLLPGPDGRGPTVGDRVWIGAHARVVGGLAVGDGATVGAGAVVIADVAARSLVLGEPARVARWDYDNSAFL